MSRALLGTTAQVVARRGIALERRAQVTLRRDAYAAAPGPTVTLSIGERTAYRPAAWLLDAFDRAALGTGWAAWGGLDALVVDSETVVPAAIGPASAMVHTLAMPRDVWIAVELAALSGPSALVGVLVRATDTDGYRVTATSAGQTILERVDAGTPTTLATVATPWRAGDTLRVELAWNRLRVFRDLIGVVDQDVGVPGGGGPLTWDGGGLWDGAGLTWDGGSAAGLTGAQVGLVAGRAVSGDAAAIGAVVAGALRHEYLGAGLDLGDVQQVLGEPCRVDVTLSNVAPMGGAASFAALLRHGTNVDGYDLDRGTVRILTAIQGATAPLTAAVGEIDAVSALTEDRARLAIRGRDAFLTPQLAPGVVTYLPGPDPGGLLPLPADPCAAAVPPVIEPGDVPADPLPAPPAEGIGPEAPAPGGGGLGVLVGGVTDLLGAALEHPSTVDAANPALGHAWVLHQTDGDGGTLAIPQHRQWASVDRTPALIGTHLAAADGYPLQLVWTMVGTRWREVGGPGSGIYGYSGFLEDTETAVYADVTVQLVELGMPNPSHDPAEVAAHPLVPIPTLEAFTNALADPATFTDPARVLAVLSTWTIAGGSTQYQGGIERILTIGGTGHAAGKIPIGGALCLALQVDGVTVPTGTFTFGPLTNVSHTGYFRSTFSGALVTILTPPPDPPP